MPLTLYLATAHDILYDPAAPSKYEEQRASLDQRRIQAIQTYLAAETSGRHLNFEVVVHDPPEMGIAAYPMGVSVQKMYLGFQGSLGAAVGTGAPGGTSGGAPPGGAPAGAPGAAPAGGSGGGASGGPPR